MIEQQTLEVRSDGRATIEITREVEAVVREMEDFPQEIGFLRKNDELPTAREKAYVVRADFVGTSQEMKAGLEVKVLR